MIWHAVKMRLIHTAATLAVFLIVWTVVTTLVIALMFMNIFFYAGNTGKEHETVHAFLTQLNYFGEGAVLGAGAVALVNAISRPRPFWLIPIAAGALLGGALFLAKPAIPQRIDALVGPYVRAAYDRSKRGEEAEKEAVIAFVRAQKAATDAVGPDYKADADSGLKVAGTVVRYMVTLTAPGPVTAWAIVTVERPSGGPVFRLACVLPPGTQSVDIRRCQ